MPEPKRTGVLLAMPSPFAVLTPFFQSVLQMVLDPELAIYPYLPPGTVIHLARDDSIKLARRMEEVEYLCFLDTDQIVDRLVLRRLIRWCQSRPEVHAVAPIIVQRTGDPIPVVYKEKGILEGTYRYEEQGDQVTAYLSQFEEDWYTAAPSGCLPTAPHRASPLELPPDIQANLADPLLKVDAVGTGMVVISREALLKLESDPETGLFCSFSKGGEDFELSRRLRAAGYGIYADRGCWVGHLTNYSRGVGDMVEFLLSRSLQRAQDAEDEAKLPRVVPDLLNDAAPRTTRPWDGTMLPNKNGRVAPPELVPAG